MNIVANYMENSENLSLEMMAIILAASFVLSVIFVFIIPKIIGIFRKKNVSGNVPEPKEEAVYFNVPEVELDNNCIGREDLLKEVYEKIVNDENFPYTRMCIVVKGKEGIGKTLFCYTLFQYRLRRYPVYLGWIMCQGKISVYDIIKKNFKDPRFFRKNKADILKALKELDKTCILFVDQIDQYTSMDELEELYRCPNVILILSGLLKKIKFEDYAVTLPPLLKKDIRTIFERELGEEIEFMKSADQRSVRDLLDEYVKGNPFLARAFAKAKDHYDGKWNDMLKHVQEYEYDDSNYFKGVLRRLYKINKLDDGEKDAVSKLSVIRYKSFAEVVFELFDIPDGYVKRLCNTYWLVKEDRALYSMDEVHRDVIGKVLPSKENLKAVMHSITRSLASWEVDKDNGFKWISLYAEDILEKVQGYETDIMETDIFSMFAFQVAQKYRIIGNREKCLEWIELCKPKDEILEYQKTCMELSVKTDFLDTLFSYSEIKRGYLDILEKAKTVGIYKSKEKYLMEEYCRFLIGSKKYEEAIWLCEKYFQTDSMDLSNESNCDMFFWYLEAANLANDEEILKRLVNRDMIQALYQNENVSVTAAWSFGELGKIYQKRGDKEASDIYIRHMVVLLNEKRGFFHSDIKDYLEVTDEEFAEYMHSCDELSDSFNEALDRKDAEALYIEGRYQEKQGNFNEAFELYEEAAQRDSLRGMCSLALMYYKGQGEEKSYEKAWEYWSYCRERGHRGSYYWSGVLLLDTDYKGYDSDKAMEYLTKAAESGSKRAKQLLARL